MIELAAVVCLLSTPAKCRDLTFTFDSDRMTPYECALTGQFELVKWTTANPLWRISSFTCREAGSVAKL